MADNKQDDQNRFLRESWVGIISSAGLASVLIVIIGRVWTKTYFDHFGLPSSGMEFSIYDFAFRSLEALITLVLGAIGFSAAWLSREQLKKWGFVSALIEALLVIGLILYLVFVLPRLPDSWLATTGFLGLSSGLALAAMLWLSVDVLAGPGGGVTRWPKRAQHALRLILIRVNSFLRFLRLNGQVDREEAVAFAWRIIAVIMLFAIGFLYLPRVSERLAAIEAAADVATGVFSAAILEAESPLPDAIASSADPTRSVPVRVILTRSQNTYVLHSTDCTTIGGMDVSTTVEGFLPPEAPDVCKVFTIPTSRLKSIEYFQVSGRAPPNESLLYPIEVGLGEEPLKESFSSEGASDEQTLVCAMESRGATRAEGGTQKPVRFYNSIWYEFMPATNGAVLTRVETEKFMPVIGIWQAPEGATDVQRVAGSGDDGSACEAEAKKITIEEPADGSGSDSRIQTKNVVGVVANVQAGTRYVVSVGAQENGGGAGSVSFEFWPGGYFFNPAIAEAQAQVPEVETTPEPGPARLGAAGVPPAEDLVSQAQALAPQVEIVSGVGTAKLELWRLDPETYELQSLPDIPEDIRHEFLRGEFTLESEGEKRQFFEETGEGEEQPPELTAEDLGEGVWKLVVPEGFAGLTRLSATVHPDLILAFADTSSLPLRDACVQRALLLVLVESEIRDELGYEGNVIFDPDSFDGDCRIAETSEDATTRARQLLDEAGFEERFPIQIQAEEEQEILLAAADIVRQRLLDIGLDAAVEPCTDACIRVFFASEAV